MSGAGKNMATSGKGMRSAMSRPSANAPTVSIGVKNGGGMGGGMKQDMGRACKSLQKQAGRK